MILHTHMIIAEYRTTRGGNNNPAVLQMLGAADQSMKRDTQVTRLLANLLTQGGQHSAFLKEIRDSLSKIVIVVQSQVIYLKCALCLGNTYMPADMAICCRFLLTTIFLTYCSQTLSRPSWMTGPLLLTSTPG